MVKVHQHASESRPSLTSSHGQAAGSARLVAHGELILKLNGVTGRAIINLLIFLSVLFSVSSAAAEMTVIGVVMTGNTPYYMAMHHAFVETLNSRIPAEKQIKILLQKPFPDPIALSNAARKLIAADVDIIVTYGSPAAVSVLREKSRIPLVYAGVYDPELSSVGGLNVTGIGYKIPLSSLLRYLRNISPLTTLSVVYSSLDEDSVRQTDELLDLGKQQHLKLMTINIRGRGDVAQFESKTKGMACFITGSSLVHLEVEDIVSIVRERRQVTVDIVPDPNESGVIMTLYQPAEDQGGKAAEMVFRIMQGEQPKMIAPEIFRNTELVVNLRAARKLGLNIPMHIIAEATRVIR